MFYANVACRQVDEKPRYKQGGDFFEALGGMPLAVVQAGWLGQEHGVRLSHMQPMMSMRRQDFQFQNPSKRPALHAHQHQSPLGQMISTVRSRC